tara:strand:- start:1400 stop:3907 length:2508 start_codon:yes stop_codon:yes gene_type:complete
MAHGFLSYEDSRGEKDYLGMLGKKLYSMAKNRPKGKKGSGDVELKKEGDEVKPQLTLPAAADTPALPGAERKALPGFKGSSIVPFKGSALSRVSTSTGPKAVTPEVMGGALTTITRKPGINAGSDVFDTTATRIADTEALQGIGDLIVRSNNNVVDALMGVQRVTVRVVDSVENLGRLQAAIASSEEQHREVLASRASAAAERAELGQTSDNSDFGKVKGLLKGGGGKGGGFVNMPGLGALARGAGGLVRGGARGIKGLAGRFAGRTAGKAAGKAGAKAGLKAGAKGLGKAFLKKIPLVGLGAGLLFAGQRAMAGDLTGAALELASGAAGTIPGFGTAASVGIDAALAGRDMGLTPFATGGIVTRPTAGLVGEQGREGVFPLEGSQGKKTFTKFGEGFLEAQVKNDKDSAKVQAQGLAQYYEKDGGAKVLGEAIVEAEQKEKKSGFWKNLFGGGNKNEKPNAAAALQSLNSGNNTSPNGGLNGGNYTGKTKVGQNAPALSGVSIGLNSMLGGQPQFNSGFGYRNTGLAGASKNHMGHDYGVTAGAEQLAFESGTIVDMMKDFGGFGTGIVIQHEDGSANVYGHVKPMPGLKIGDKINRGDKLGHYEYWAHPRYPNGRQHLHFERIPQYNPKDPRKGQIDPTSYLQALTPLEKNEINRDISALTRGNRSTKDGEAGALGASGYTKGDRVNFMHNGQEYHGYRKDGGWDLYKGRGFGATKLNMSQEVLQGSGEVHKHSSEVFGAFKEYLKANPGSQGHQSNLYNPDVKTASLGNELYKSFDMTASLGGQFPTGATVINNYYNNGSSGSNEAQLTFGVTMNSSLGSGLTWNEAKEALT